MTKPTYTDANHWHNAALNSPAVAEKLLLNPAEMKRFTKSVDYECWKDQETAYNGGYEPHLQQSEHPEKIFQQYIKNILDRHPDIAKKYWHQQRYIRAYEDQEWGHTWRRHLNRAIAVLATIIPPLSLILTINLAKQDIKKCNPDPKLKKELLESIILTCIIVAIVPGLSGWKSWETVNLIEKNNRENDIIKKEHETNVKKFKSTHTFFKKVYVSSLFRDEIKKKRVPNKPKKVFVPSGNGTDIYMDREQALRHTEPVFDPNNLGASFKTDTYLKHQQQSVALVKQLEDKYTPEKLGIRCRK